LTDLKGFIQTSATLLLQLVTLKGKATSVSCAASKK